MKLVFPLTGLAIGATVCLLALFGAPISGASLRKFIKELLFFIIILLLSTSIPLSVTLSAQNYRDMGIPFIRNYTSEVDYKAGWQNWGVFQDRRGVMYFANQYGVLEYDGKYWNLIELPNYSLVFCLAADAGGTIFVSAMGEFGYLASDAKGKLSYVSLLDKIKKEDRIFNDVWDICINPRGVYFLTLTKIFRLHQNMIQVIPLQAEAQRASTAYEEIFVTFEDSDISVVQGNRVIPLPQCGKICSKKYGEIFVLPYPGDQLILLTMKGDFFLYDLKMLRDPVSKSFDFKKKNVPGSILKPFPTAITQYIDQKHNQCNGFRALTGNRYAVFTQEGGIVIMDRDGQLLQVINKVRGLKDNFIWDVYEDNNHNLWAAANNGLSYIQTGSPVTHFDDTAGLNGLVTEVTRFNGKLIAATFEGIFYLPVYQLKLKNDNHLFAPLENAKGVCWDFFQVKNKLLAEVKGELLQINDAFAVKRYTGSRSYCFGWTGKFPNIIFQGGNGLSSFRMTGTGAKGKNDIEFIYNGKFKGIDPVIRKITADANGNLWVASGLNGIFHIRFEGNSIENYRLTHYTTAQGLPQNDWNFVHFFNNRLLISTRKGLYEGIPSPGSKSEYRFVPEKTIGSVIPNGYRDMVDLVMDKNGSIWVISCSGIGTIEKKPGGSYRWNSIPFNAIPHEVETIFLDQQGILWAASPRGLYRFDSTMPKDYWAPFNALIRKVTKGRDAVIFSGTYINEHSRVGQLFTVSTLNQPQAQIPTIEYIDNSLTFEFSAAYYEQEQENRFNYILEGFDKNWSDWTTQHKKEYTNLAEGQYRFRVRARNIYEHPSSEAVFAFTISPPWYRTIPAYIAWILLTGGFMTGVVKLYLLRRKVEKNLRESEEKFRVLAEKSVVGICILQDNAVKYANPRFHEIFRYAPGQMTGKNLLDWVKEEDRSLVTVNLKIQAIDPLRSEAFEFRGMSAAGDMIHLEGRGTQTQYKGKTAFLETIIDITDRKKAEEELMQSKKLETVGILSSGIAHDFNNLLAIIMGNLSLAQNNIHQPCERLEKYMIPMETATSQAADLVKNFITLAAGGWIEFKKISLTDILKNIGDEAPQLKEIPYTLSIPGNLKPIHGDERKLRRVMGNLLINAYEALTRETTPEPAPIMIKAQNITLDKNNPWNLQEGEYVKVSVIDAGKGIPPYHLDKIFDPYFSTKQRGAQKGMGMGLAICNAIVKKHNGHIVVSSEVDKGTVVDLFLPAGELQTSNELPCDDGRKT